MTEQQKIGALLVTLCLMLVFTAIMSYAYFTAYTQNENAGEITFGHLQLNLQDFNAYTECCKDAGVIVPGCTIKLNAKLDVDTNINCFVRICFSCFVNDKTDDTFSKMIFLDMPDCLKSSGWYYHSNYYYRLINVTDTEIKTFDFNEIALLINKEQIGNDYQGKKISFKMEAEAIQSAHLNENISALQSLKDNENVLRVLASSNAWPSNSSQGQGETVGGNNEDEGSGEDNLSTVDDNGKDLAEKISDSNPIRYYVNGALCQPCAISLDDNKSSVQIETQYCEKDNWEEFCPFETIKLPQIKDKKLKLTFDVALKDEKSNLDDNALQNVQNNFMQEIILYQLNVFVINKMDTGLKLDNLENNQLILPYNTNFISLLEGFYLSTCEDYVNYAIKFKLKIELIN